MLIGYAQVSTYDQNLSLQNDPLLEAECERIFEGRLSGAKTQRPGLSEALSYTRTERYADPAVNLGHRPEEPSWIHQLAQNTSHFSCPA